MNIATGGGGGGSSLSTWTVSSPITVGFTAGAFDLLHAGHVYFLEEASKRCGRLVVGLHTDPSLDRQTKNKPVQSTYERYVQLRGLRCVDQIIPYDTEGDLLNLLATNKFDVRFLGTDYIDKPFTGSMLCRELDVRLEYIPRKHDYSSSDLRRRVYKDEGMATFERKHNEAESSVPGQGRGNKSITPS